MSDHYTQQLINKLTEQSKWTSFMVGKGFAQLAMRVGREVNANTLSGKIAHIFVQHQLLHEIIKELIELSNLYVQGEIWPTVFEPAYDSGKDKMTGWYINYYEQHCIDSKGKKELLVKAKKLNAIRNKVVHNLFGKNEAVIESSFRQFESTFKQAEKYLDQCHEDLYWRLNDLNKRVDFKDLL